jgi:alpha-mannosidase
VSNDEATVEYYNAMEQMYSGHKFLYETFGIVPHVGWQLDSFGYSAYTPTLLKKLGYDTLVMARMSTNIKEKLRYDGHLQFIWKGHPDSPSSTSSND